MTRGAAFEDEKARIIKSCYAKKDDDGTCTYTGEEFLLTPPMFNTRALGNTLRSDLPRAQMGSHCHAPT
jgi:hypothetical protein